MSYYPKTCNFTICSIFSNSGHVGWCTASPDTILKLDILVMIQTKFGFNWSSSFIGDDFWKSLQRMTETDPKWWQYSPCELKNKKNMRKLVFLHSHLIYFYSFLRCIICTAYIIKQYSETCSKPWIKMSSYINQISNKVKM